MDRAKMVRIGTEQVASGAYFDRIRVVIGDLQLRCDVTSERDIRLAKRLADSHGADFIVHPDLAGKVAAALSTYRAPDDQTTERPRTGAEAVAA